MTKVLVVDDHESMRESLERLFNESGDFCVVGGISCADHAVRMCGELSPDIVFMDVCTEGGAWDFAQQRGARCLPGYKSDSYDRL